MSNFQELVSKKLKSARKKHARQISSPHDAYANILEELDEVKLEVWKKTKKRNLKKLLAELVDVAAMCQRSAEDLELF